MYQLLVILFIVLAVIGVRRIQKQAPKDRSKLFIKYALYALVLISVLLVISGRLHWIAGAATLLFPLLQRILPIALRALPFIKKAASREKTPTPPSTMEVEQALKVLGLEAGANDQDIIKRHKELIQKNHPDRGGSDFLAAQINEAKDILLNQNASSH